MNESLTVQLVARLGQSEDPWVERKASFDETDVRRTLVAFANSVNEGQIAVLFIGARNGGQHPGVRDADDMQKKLAGVATKKCYPPIEYQTCVLKVEVGGKKVEVLSVMVPFSKSRPHFGGIAHIRRGSETVEASHEVFLELIASQNDKARKLLQFKGKKVTLRFRSESGFSYDIETRVDQCDAHTLRLIDQVSVLWSFNTDVVTIYEEGVFGMVITVRPRWTEAEQIRKIIQLWTSFARHSKLSAHSLDRHHFMVEQLLANPEKTINAAGALADGTADPWLMLLMATVRFELKKIQRPMTRDQKIEYLDGQRATLRRVRLAGADALYSFQVDTIAEIVTSVEEADEFLKHFTHKNPPEIQPKQRTALYRKLGIPES
jgi:schlafen family protein